MDGERRGGNQTGARDARCLIVARRAAPTAIRCGIARAAAALHTPLRTRSQRSHTCTPAAGWAARAASSCHRRRCRPRRSWRPCRRRHPRSAAPRMVKGAETRSEAGVGGTPVMQCCTPPAAPHLDMGLAPRPRPSPWDLQLKIPQDSAPPGGRPSSKRWGPSPDSQCCAAPLVLCVIRVTVPAASYVYTPLKNG
jgi:hypothetical protein